MTNDDRLPWFNWQNGHCSAPGHGNGHDISNASARPLHGAYRATHARLSFYSNNFADVWILFPEFKKASRLFQIHIFADVMQFERKAPAAR